MSDSDPPGGAIRVRYWASARTAAGCEYDDISVPTPISLSQVVTQAVSRHPGTGLADVLAACSVLLGDRPVSTQDADDVMVAPGASVEFLPPFAGG